MQTDMKESKISQRSQTRFQALKNISPQSIFRSEGMLDFSHVDSQFSDKVGKFVPKKSKKNKEAVRADIESKCSTLKAKIDRLKNDQLPFFPKSESIAKIKRKQQRKNCNPNEVLRHLLQSIKDTLRLFNQIMLQLQMKLKNLKDNWQQSFLCTVKYFREKVDQGNGFFFSAEMNLCSNCLSEKLLNQICKSSFSSPKESTTQNWIRSSSSPEFFFNKGRFELKKIEDLMQQPTQKRASQTCLTSKSPPQMESQPRVNIFYQESLRKVPSKGVRLANKMNEIISKMRQALLANKELIV